MLFAMALLVVILSIFGAVAASAVSTPILMLLPLLDASAVETAHSGSPTSRAKLQTFDVGPGN